MPDRLGIISDTHGRTPCTRKAIELLLARGASRIIHLGDVGNEAILDLLVGIEATVVFGNCDDERSMARYAEILGLHVVHPGAVIEVKSKRIGLTHGHLESELDRLFASNLDFLLHGHTHEIRDDCIRGTRLLNPGALHRAARRTVMLLDPASGEAEWIDIDADNGTRRD